MTFRILAAIELLLVPALVLASYTPAVSESKQATPLQKKALASLGRNVLHFQRLEAQLKLLALFCDFQSPLDQFTANHKKKAERVRLKTLGILVSELHESLYGKPPDLLTAKGITEASLAIGFRVDADPEYLNQQRQKLSDLVLERNRLIHHDLAAFNPDSSDSCRILIARLDEQNDRVLIQLKAVQQLVNTCKQCFQSLLAAMNSKEWRQGFAPRPKRP
jgi:hypothetical protein